VFQNVYRNRRVLVTGHTGFKGSWLCCWLKNQGAELCGIALPMPAGPNHASLLKTQMRSETCDIREPEKVLRVVTDFRPEIVFHLAAQALVRPSCREPAETFDINVMGTVNVLEACRRTPSVRAIVAVTSDKCYENRGDGHACEENDPMGGVDPYAASKGCAELVISSYRRCFFPEDGFGRSHRTLLASGRAGNVLGGGDWAEDRLVPDIMKAAAENRTAKLRDPDATRPWQHVLEPLSGYLALGQKLLEGRPEFAAGWNFGPDDPREITVGQCAAVLAAAWPQIRYKAASAANAPREAKRLRLNCTKARERLFWHGVWSPEEALRRTAEWYRAYYTDGTIRTAEDLSDYVRAAEAKELAWTK